MESSITVFLLRRPACERLPTLLAAFWFWRACLRERAYVFLSFVRVRFVNVFVDVLCVWACMCSCQLCVRALCALAGAACIIKFRWCFGTPIAGGHTASNAPDHFRPPKLIGAGPS